MPFPFPKLFKRSAPTINVRNITNKYINNSLAISKALGEKIIFSKEALKFKPKRMYVLDFHGDKMASRTEPFGEEISSIISIVNPKDDLVLIRVHSYGGAVSAYGYASSQIQRLKDVGVRVTVAIDRAAASGGYMMACVADEIIAAPFATIGSIGVVAEFPNFSKFLKEMGIDYKQYTAGKFKRTFSLFGDISEEAEEEIMKDLNDTHDRFKNHVSSYRKELDLEEVANGKVWYGTKAKEIGLVDSVMTSDEFIMRSMINYNVIKIDYIGERDTFGRLIGSGLSGVLANAVTMIYRNIVGDVENRWR